MEARINKFRPNPREVEREARAEVLARMMADHEITWRTSSLSGRQHGDPIPGNTARKNNRALSAP